MSLANKLEIIYTNLDSALEDINSAIIAKGLSEAVNIGAVGNKIRAIEQGGSDKLAMDVIDKSVKTITLYDISSIGDYAFYKCNRLESVTIPDSVTSIGASAFNLCESLKNITIPDGVTYIGIGAFQYCESLTNITIPNGVTSINDDTFSDCYSLTNITIPDSVTSIGSHAFHKCLKLTSVTIPDSVTFIGGSAFHLCGNYGGNGTFDIYLKSQSPPLLEYANAISTYSTIHVPIGSGDAYKSATNWSKYADKIVEDIVVE